MPNYFLINHSSEPIEFKNFKTDADVKEKYAQFGFQAMLLRFYV